MHKLVAVLFGARKQAKALLKLVWTKTRNFILILQGSESVILVWSYTDGPQEIGNVKRQLKITVAYNR